MKKYIALFLLALSHHAVAAEYKSIDYSKSYITFTSEMMGSKVNGSFKKFSGDIKFDSQQPKLSRGKLTIDISSFKAGGEELIDEAMGKLWFDQTHFPKAEFVLEHVQGQGSQLQIAGKLTIKNKTRPLIVPATLLEQGHTAIVDAVFTIKRLDFSLGEGLWSDTSSVTNEVPVKVHLILNKSP